MTRVNNYNAGPSALPLAVLEQARDELLDFDDTGMSVMELSHRSLEFDAVHNEALDLAHELLGLDERWKILLLQGGATQQFALVPMNLLGGERRADYLLSGSWSKKAITAARLYGKARAAADTEADGRFERVPRQDELDLDPGATYCHITTNNTIFGTQFSSFPETGPVPLVADMSSDILSRRFDPGPFGLFYAGAQKNLGPSGVCLVAIREDLLEQVNPDLPPLFSYAGQAAKNSLLNTPPTLAIYLLGLVLKWVRDQGGVEAMERQNQEKAELLYGLIDGSGGFYRNPVERGDRSWMNAVFRLPDEELEQRLVAEATSHGLVGLKGHRSVGGIRVSMYNATSVESIRQLAGFLEDFRARNG